MSRTAGEDVLSRYIRMVAAGKKQSPEEYLKKHPRSKRLRKALEGALILDILYRRFRELFPDADVEKLFDVPNER